MSLLWLADVLRDAGLDVVEHAGWQTHARPGSWTPRYGVVHATAAPRGQADAVQVDVVRNGRADLPGPIANAAVDRSGRWHVLSAGRCNSTLTGTAGPYVGLGNTYALSVEGCNDNGLGSPAEPWPAVQYRAYVAGWAAWCRRLGWDAGRLVGHKEHTPGRKTDPTFNMDGFRRDVAELLTGGDDDMTPDELLRADVLPDVAGKQYTVGGAIHTTLIRAGSIAEQLATVRGDITELGQDVTELGDKVNALADKVNALAAGPAIDYDRLADAIVRRAVGGAPQV